MSESHKIDVRPIPKPQRHPLIFAAMDKLAVGDSVVVKNDHNPIPLRRQVEELYGGQFSWKYLEQGPDVFRLCFTRVTEGEPQAAQISRPSALPLVNPNAGEA